jgi:Holliday junction resolvase RusA-like endonuclease
VPWARTRPRFRPKPGSANLYFTPERQRDYATAVGLKAKRIMRGRRPNPGPLLLRVACVYRWHNNYSAADRAAPGYFWKRTRPDADNMVKLVMDACNEIIWTDDAVVTDVRIVRLFHHTSALYVHVRQAPLTFEEMLRDWDGLFVQHYTPVVTGEVDDPTDEVDEPGSGSPDQGNT